jgi:hypothetical protein
MGGSGLRRLCADGQNRNGSATQNPFGNASHEQVPDTASTVRAHYDEVALKTVRVSQYLLSRHPVMRPTAGG